MKGIQTTVKVKQYNNTLMVVQGGKRVYSSYSYTISALDEGEWSASCPGRALLPGKRLMVPFVQ
jgi:hypothetical protein